MKELSKARRRGEITMTKYIIDYYFDGTGKVEVEANSEEEAKDKFFDGNWKSSEEEQGDNYNIEFVNAK